MGKIKGFKASYARRRLEEEMLEKVREYENAGCHPQYAKRCARCGTPFVGRDWRFAETSFCSAQCELESSTKAYATYIRLWWKYFGKDIKTFSELGITKGKLESGDDEKD